MSTPFEMLTLKDVFDLQNSSLKDVRALGGEVIEVPLKQGRHAPKYIELLGEDLVQFMCRFTGRGYALSRETMSAGDTRYVREPGYDAFGLKLFVDGSRILIGRVAVLMDETILRNYAKYLKRAQVEEVAPAKVDIQLPDNWCPGTIELPADQTPGADLGAQPESDMPPDQAVEKPVEGDGPAEDTAPFGRTPNTEQ
jgi:hypothetical protein